MSKLAAELTRSDDELRAHFHALRGLVTVADLLEVKPTVLVWHLYRRPPTLQYRRFTIPKSSGGSRTIVAPTGGLKILQEKLARVLTLVFRPPASAHGFLPARSVVTNASRHLRQRWVLNVDLEDFFPSIHFGRVRGMFMAPPYALPARAATVIAQICCVDQHLPQGAPTSPIVSNMLCQRLDNELRRLARGYKCTVTRYADDITISTASRLFPAALAEATMLGDVLSVNVGKELAAVIRSNGFTLNTSKCRLQPSGRRQEVTGLVVNKKCNVRREFILALRGMLHAWERFSEKRAQAAWRLRHDRKRRAGGNGQVSFRRVVAGKLAYLRMVKGAFDSTYRRLQERYDVLVGKPSVYDALWVLEEVGVAQGTGFLVEGVGLITCNHVVAPTTNLVAYQPSNPGVQFPVQVHHRSEAFDLAVCEILRAPRTHRLRLAKRAAVQGEDVRLLGFPNHAPGAQVFDAIARVAQIRRHMRAEVYVLSGAQILTGNSGGPVLDARGLVLGVARRGVGGDDGNAESSAVAAGFIDATLGFDEQGYLYPTPLPMPSGFHP